MGEVYVARQAIDANPRDLLAVFGEHSHLWFVRVISPSFAMAVDAVRDNRKLRQSLILSPWMTSQALHICLHVSFVTEGHGLLDWLVALARRRGQSDHRDRRDKEKPDIHHRGHRGHRDRKGTPDFSAERLLIPLLSLCSLWFNSSSPSPPPRV